MLALIFTKPRGNDWIWMEVCLAWLWKCIQSSRSRSMSFYKQVKALPAYQAQRYILSISINLMSAGDIRQLRCMDQKIVLSYAWSQIRLHLRCIQVASWCNLQLDMSVNLLQYSCCLQLDVRSRKLFLRRCSLDGVTLVPELLRPGSRVDILSRQLRIIDYADIFTKDELAHRQER